MNANAPEKNRDTAPTLAEVRERFLMDRFATENGAVIDSIGPRTAVCSMKVSDSHRNAYGSVMGGALFTLADFAFAVAANWNDCLHVSRTNTITFLSMPKGDTLYAEAVCLKEGGSTCLYKVTVRDSEGRDAAYVTVDGHVFRGR